MKMGRCAPQPRRLCLRLLLRRPTPLSGWGSNSAATLRPPNLRRSCPARRWGLPPTPSAPTASGDYLIEVRETLPLYTEDGVAHPGWILRDANYVLSANVRLGPWIHVESAVQHFALVRDGDEVSARAVVTDEWERKGHRFVTLDVLHLASSRPVARTTHTAIYRPRGT